MHNGGLALEDDPPPPQRLWKKVLCGIVMVVLTLFACLYLLLFGVQQGKAMTKAWWVASMTGLVLGAVFYEPFSIFVQFVLLPTMLRQKLEVLADPTAIKRFPFHAQLHESPTAYLAQKHRELLVARRLSPKHHAAHRRPGALHALGPEGTAAELSGDNLALTRVKPSTGAHIFILIWSLIIVLPESAQSYLIDTISGALTVLVLLVAKAVSELQAHWKVSTAVASGAVALGVIGYCAHSHKARSDAKDDDDDGRRDEDEDEDEGNGEAR